MLRIRCEFKVSGWWDGEEEVFEGAHEMPMPQAPGVENPLEEVIEALAARFLRAEVDDKRRRNPQRLAVEIWNIEYESS